MSQETKDVQSLYLKTVVKQDKYCLISQYDLLNVERLKELTGVETYYARTGETVQLNIKPVVADANRRI